jgi:predicted dehydrogenase
MANRRLRWGLLGTARINRAVIPPLRASERNELAGVASRSLVKAESYAREWHIPRAFASYEAMLADPDIDVVYIPLPNSMHVPWTLKAIAAGKHVLCEKPLATTLEGIDAVIAAGREKGVVVAEAFMYRHHRQTLTVKELIAGGALGELRLIRGAFSFSLGRAGDVRLDPTLDGGSLWDVGCYPVSYSRYVAGAEPLAVFGWQKLGPTGVDVVFAGELRFPGDVLAQFDSGFDLPFRAEMEFIGTSGQLVVDDPYKPGLAEELRLWRGDELETVPVRDHELYRGEVEDMADAVLNGKTPRVTLEDSRGNAAALIALYRSAVEGRPISL